jgi:hypothetical protein
VSSRMTLFRPFTPLIKKDSLAGIDRDCSIRNTNRAYNINPSTLMHINECANDNDACLNFVIETTRDCGMFPLQTVQTLNDDSLTMGSTKSALDHCSVQCQIIFNYSVIYKICVS